MVDESMETWGPDLRGFPMSSSPGKDSPMHVADNFSWFFLKKIHGDLIFEVFKT